MAKIPVEEDTQLLSTFVDVNSSKAKSNNISGIFKSIGAYVFGNASSQRQIITDPIDNSGFSSISDVFKFENGVLVQDKLNEFRTMSASRYRQYATYDQMAEDTLIASAVDMYADDATQTDKNGEQIWITADEPKDARIVQSIFDSFDMKDKIWKIARMLAHYGDVYLECFYNKNEKAEVKLKESINIEKSRKDYTNVITEVDKTVHDKSDGYILSEVRIVPDIENVFDLQVNGKTVAYAKVGEQDTEFNATTGYISPKEFAGEVKYYPPDKFIHFYLDQSDRRNLEYFVVDLDDGSKFRFEIARGKSMIHDVFRAHRELQLLEYSILLNRVSRSSILRFVQVEVGNMSKSNVDVTLRKVKNLVESKQTLNTESGNYKPYKDPGPIENYLYIPVRNGQGSISVNTIGGDVNIRDIADIDYYLNKVFAGLKVPKTALNFENTLASFGGGGAFTKQDARYGRSVKRLQSFIIRGFRNLLDIVLQNRGLAYLIGRYEVRMVQPASIEDDERDTLFSNRIELIKSFTDAVSALSENDQIHIDVDKLIDYISNDIMDDPAIKEILVVKEQNSKDEESDSNIGTAGGSPIENDIDVGGGANISTLPDENSLAEPIETEPESNNMEDFEGEWQDLT